MPNYGVQKSSIAAVMSWYSSQPETKFAIYRGNKVNDAYLSGGYYGNDKDEASAVLESTLHEIEPSDFNVYFLKLQPDNAKSKTAAPGVTFQLHSPVQQSGYQVAGTNNNSQAMHEILNEIRALRAERLAELESDDEEEEEEPQSDMLAGVLNSPQMQNILIGMLQNMFTSAPKQPQGIAGVETSPDELQKVVEQLLVKGATVADLQKLAAMDQGQFSWLLSMLRK